MLRPLTALCFVQSIFKSGWNQPVESLWLRNPAEKLKVLDYWTVARVSWPPSHGKFKSSLDIGHSSHRRDSWRSRRRPRARLLSRYEPSHPPGVLEVIEKMDKGCVFIVRESANLSATSKFLKPKTFEGFLLNSWRWIGEDGRKTPRISLVLHPNAVNSRSVFIIDMCAERPSPSFWPTPKLQALPATQPSH